jgi:hypothetical protein
VRGRKEEQLDPNELLTSIAEWVMRIDAKLDQVLDHLEENDGEAEEDS